MSKGNRESESTKTDTSIESAAGREEDLVVVVSSGEHVLFCR